MSAAEKPRTWRAALLAAVALATVGAQADTTYTWYDGTVYTWRYRLVGGGAEICKSGDDPAVTPAPTGAVAIPDKVDGVTVTRIGADAFTWCTELTALTIPAGVTRIEKGAFSGCSKLVSFDVHSDNLDYKSELGLLLTRSGHELVAAAGGLTSVTIPDSVRNIGAYAFYECGGLTSVTIPANVTNIEDWAFTGCDKLASFTIASGNSCFKSSDSGLLLTKDGTELVAVPGGASGVTIPDGVTCIAARAFAECRRLTSVAIPDGVTRIGEQAFFGCEASLYDTTSIPGVRLVDGWAVGGAGALSGDLDLTGVRGIGDFAFAGCSGLTSVTIGGGVAAIGASAFSGCGGLASVTLADGVTTIGEGAFANCSGLTDVPMPDSATTIGNSAFFGCGGLASVTIPAAVTDIGDFAFSGCGALAKISFLGNAPTIGQHAFDAVAPDCTVYVREGSTGWNVGIPGTWGDLKIDYAPDGPVPPEPGPGPVPPEPEPVAAGVLYETVEGVVPTVAASEYNGYLVDAQGAVKGTIQVKVGKPGKKDGKASVKATVVLGGKKVVLKAADKGKAEIDPNGPTTVALSGGEACSVVLGAKALSGVYGAYAIDGARNFFTSKNKNEVADANAILGLWFGPVQVVWDGGSLSVSLANKGKAKVAGTLADGKTKVSANSVFLIGEAWCCVPVVAPKANLAFALWLSLDGSTTAVEGLGANVVVGKPGTLVAGAKFHIDAAAFSAVWGLEPLPYLPDGIAVEQQGAKWIVAGGAKAGKVVYKDGVVDESKLGVNPSGLKLTYKSKEGSFKGSFKAYAVSGGKLKSATVSVLGVMINGVGYGTAAIKGKGSVTVTIK